MFIYQLKQSIKDDINSENFTLQAVFNRHIDEIISLKKDGYTYKKIHLLLELGIHEKHFRDLIYRSRVKKNKSDFTAWTECKQRVPQHANDHTEIKVTDRNIDADSSSILSLDDWIFETGINNLSNRLIGRLEEKGLTPRKIKELNLTNTTLINKHLATIESQSKYK